MRRATSSRLLIGSALFALAPVLLVAVTRDARVHEPPSPRWIHNTPDTANKAARERVILEQRLYGISPSHQILYTSPGFTTVDRISFAN